MRQLKGGEGKEKKNRKNLFKKKREKEMGRIHPSKRELVLKKMTGKIESMSNARGRIKRKEARK